MQAETLLERAGCGWWRPRRQPGGFHRASEGERPGRGL